MKRVSRLAGVLLCGLCALGLIAAVALAGPVGWGSSYRLSAAHARTHACRARTRVHHRARSRCRHRRSTSTGGAPGFSPEPAPPLPPGAGAGSGATNPGVAGIASPGSGQGPSSGPGEATPPTTPPSIPHVQVTALEYSFTLSRTSVPAGKVIFELVNNGQDEHNLNVLPDEGLPAGSLPDAPSKSVSDMQMEVRKGTYTLFCSLPEHEQKGMKATLVVN